MVAEAERKRPPALADRVQFVVADVASLPFPAAGFDLVCQLNLPVFAKPVASMVAPGGHVVVASSRGPTTPYFTPHSVLRRRFGALGFDVLADGTAGAGTYFVARRAAS
jgi:ubiquinone/menaquinone biosynthesis C-methylase UbiE